MYKKTAQSVEKRERLSRNAADFRNGRVRKHKHYRKKVKHFDRIAAAREAEPVDLKWRIIGR